jgi:hypothetical protein
MKFGTRKSHQKRISRKELERRLKAAEHSIQELWLTHNDHENKLLLAESADRALFAKVFGEDNPELDEPPPDQEMIPGIHNRWPGEAENDSRIS